jgi:hypothetical protein
MYGVTPIAKIVAFENAPPDNVFRYANAELLAPLLASERGAIRSCKAEISRKGTGITEPILKQITIKIVKRIFFLRSGIIQAFLIVLNN